MLEKEQHKSSVGEILLIIGLTIFVPIVALLAISGILT